MSPRVLASLIAVTVAGAIIASCGDQPSPTVASPVALPSVAALSATQLVDMLADPAGTFRTLADTPAPIIYPPNSPPSPWPPAPPAKALPGIPVPAEPTVSGNMHITIDPEVVLHSGVPVPTAGCATNHPYTWYYTQKFSNDRGVPFTVVERTQFFDGYYAGKNTESFGMAPNGTVFLQTRWCSGYSKPHYAQTRYKIRDDSGEWDFNGPWVQLMSP
jgi:hypothetical protein